MHEVKTVGMLTITLTPKHQYSQQLGGTSAGPVLVDWNVINKCCSRCDVEANSNFKSRSHMGGITVECGTCKASETFK